MFVAETIDVKWPESQKYDASAQNRWEKIIKTRCRSLQSVNFLITTGMAMESKLMQPSCVLKVIFICRPFMWNLLKRVGKYNKYQTNSIQMLI